jgi:hypothetical protein
MSEENITPAQWIQNRIFMIRNQKVMIDADLAELYGVPTKRLNEQVKRNKERFPRDFMFRLTKKEKNEVVAKCDHLSQLKFSSSLPYAFTEHGAVMLASVLNSPKAIEASIIVVKAFVRLREILSTHKGLAQKLKELELKIESHDEQISAIFEAINQMIAPSEKPKRRIGFGVEEPKYKYSGRRK